MSQEIQKFQLANITLEIRIILTLLIGVTIGYFLRESGSVLRKRRRCKDVEWKAKIEALENRCTRLESSNSNNIFTITHYNILAEAYGSNLQPWFLYGMTPPITTEQRDELTKKHSARDDSNGCYLHTTFRAWSDGILSEKQQIQAEYYDNKVSGPNCLFY